MPKKKTLKYWKNKIDKVFHEYVRRRDAAMNLDTVLVFHVESKFIFQKQMLDILYQGNI